MNREEKKRATRERLISSSLSLFVEQGYDSTTILQITEHAGVAKGTFFNYFQSKEEVLCDLQSFFAAEALGKLQEVLDQGPLAPKLVMIVHGLVSRLKLTRSLTRLMFQGCLVNSASLYNHMRRVVELNEVLAMMFAAGQRNGEFRSDLPASMLSQLVVQTYFGLLISWSMEQGSDDLDEQIETTFGLFIRSISK